MLKFCTCTFALLILSACEPAPVIEQGADARGHVAPAPATVANNQRVLNEL